MKARCQCCLVYHSVVPHLSLRGLVLSMGCFSPVFLRWSGSSNDQQAACFPNVSLTQQTRLIWFPLALLNRFVLKKSMGTEQPWSLLASAVAEFEMRGWSMAVWMKMSHDRMGQEDMCSFEHLSMFVVVLFSSSPSWQTSRMLQTNKAQETKHQHSLIIHPTNRLLNATVNWPNLGWLVLVPNKRSIRREQDQMEMSHDRKITYPGCTT